VKRWIALSVCAVLALGVLVGVAYGVRRVLDRGGSNLVTRTLGGGGSTNGNTISIFAPTQLSKSLERVTTAYQQEHPGTTFQFTLGPGADLANRIQQGQKPSLYVDTPDALASVKARPTAPPVNFGYDWVQLAVRRGNPKQVRGLDAFAASSPFTTGTCSADLFCGQVDNRVLQAAGVNAAPRVVTSNVGDLTDGVSNGTIDAVLLPRTEIRAVLTKIDPVPLPNTVRVDYQIAQFENGPPDTFIQWLQTAPTAREALRLAGMLSFYDQ
jgi:molybdate transport system substrate-binding protein